MGWGGARILSLKPDSKPFEIKTILYWMSRALFLELEIQGPAEERARVGGGIIDDRQLPGAPGIHTIEDAQQRRSGSRCIAAYSLL